MEDVFEKALRLLVERLLEQHGCQADILITKTGPEEAPSSRQKGVSPPGAVTASELPGNKAGPARRPLPPPKV